MITEAELTKWARQAEFNKAFPKSTSPITFTDDDKILSLIAELRELRGAVRESLVDFDHTSRKQFPAMASYWNKSYDRLASLIEEAI